MLIQEMHHEFDLKFDRGDSNDRPDFQPWEIDSFLNQAIDIFVKTRYNFDKFITQGRSPQEIGFETNQFRIDELSSLHIKSPEVQPEILPANVVDDVYEFRLDDLGNNINGQYFRYMFTTKIVLKVIKDNCIRYIDGYNWQIDDRKNHFNDPSFIWSRAHCNFGKSSYVISSIANTNLMSPDYAINLSVGSNATQTNRNDKLQSVYIDTKNRLGIPEYEVLSARISYIKRPNRVCLGTYSHIDKHAPGIAVHCDLNDAFHREIINIAVNLAAGSVQDQGAFAISDKTVKEDYMS